MNPQPLLIYQPRIQMMSKDQNHYFFKTKGHEKQTITGILSIPSDGRKETPFPIHKTKKDSSNI
jgi:hypothetical protein